MSTSIVAEDQRAPEMTLSLLVPSKDCLFPLHLQKCSVSPPDNYGI